MSGAVDWFRMSNTLLTDQRLSRLASMCKVHRTMILGACAHVWGLADLSSVDGLLAEATPDGIDYDVGVPGFVAALVAIGWAEVRPDGVFLIGFLEKNGGTTSKKRRMDAAARTAKSRGKRDNGVTPAQHHRYGNSESGVAERERSVTLSTLSSDSSSGISASSEGESERKPKPGKRAAPVADWPESHRTPEVAEAWERWLKYRGERRFPAYTPTGMAAAVKKLAAHPPNVVVWALDESIANGWQGTFPEKWSERNGHGQNGGSHRTSASATEQRRADKRAREFGGDTPLDLPIVVV